MSDYVGIVRSNERLARAANRLDNIYQENKKFFKKTRLTRSLCELQNLITMAYLITRFSIERKENKGSFFNKDLT